MRTCPASISIAWRPPLGALLAEFRSAGGADDTPLYVGSTVIRKCFPGLLEENPLALGVNNPLVSIWMGTRTRIAAHFDYPDNLAAVVAGRRRFLLFPPEQIDNLYVGPGGFHPGGPGYQPGGQRDTPISSDILATGMPWPRRRWPSWDPGTRFSYPSLWWHQVEGLAAFNVLVNYWWRSVPAALGNPMDALIHCLMAFNGLPEGPAGGLAVDLRLLSV